MTGPKTGAGQEPQDARSGPFGLSYGLTEFFGPNGAMMRQAGSRVGSFTEDLSRNLAVFEHSYSIVIEPFEIRDTSWSGDRLGFLLKQLSESERFRSGVVFQIALAIVTEVAIRSDRPC